MQTKLNPVKINIKNFQSIRDLEVEVHGFTCITGPTNIGKSAIVRAASSAILNNPVGGMVKKGESFCSVELGSDGWGFKWEKNDKGVNRVWIPGKDKPLDKIGQTQVSEISSMGFSSIEIGDDEIQPWLSPQFQTKGAGPLFLLDQSGPRITDFLSEVSRLTVLQDAIVGAARGKRAATDQAKLKSEEIAELQEKLSKIVALDNLERINQDLSDQSDSIKEYEQKIKTGEELIARRREAERVIANLEPVESVKAPRDNCKDLIQKLKDLFSFCYQLESCASRVRDMRDVAKLKVPDDFSEDMKKLRELKKFAIVGPLRQSVNTISGISKVKVPDTKGLKESVDKLQQVSQFANRISSLQASVDLLDQELKVPDLILEVERLRGLSASASQIKGLQIDIANLESELESVQANIGQVDAEIAKIPSCPTCKRPVAPNHKLHMAS